MGVSAVPVAVVNTRVYVRRRGADVESKRRGCDLGAGCGPEGAEGQQRGAEQARKRRAAQDQTYLAGRVQLNGLDADVLGTSSHGFEGFAVPARVCEKEKSPGGAC